MRSYLEEERQRNTSHPSLNETTDEMLRPTSFLFTLAVVLKNSLFTGGQDITLVNGLDRCFGTVKVEINGTSGIMCGNPWHIDQAALVCSKLECGRAVIAYDSALFGKRSGSVLLFNCEKNVSNISQCSFKNKSDCDQSQDAGVVCSASSVVIIVAVVAAVLLILSALLIIFLVRRRRKQKKLQICSHSKDAVNMQDVLQRQQNEEHAEDDYEVVDMDDGDHDSDSEQDYVNVNQDDSEQDYVNIETDDSDQDYVNVNITEQRSMLDNNYEDL